MDTKDDGVEGWTTEDANRKISAHETTYNIERDLLIVDRFVDVRVKEAVDDTVPC